MEKVNEYIILFLMKLLKIKIFWHIKEKIIFNFKLFKILLFKILK